MAAHLNAHKPATASRWVVAPTRLANETAIHFHAHAADAHHLKLALDAGGDPDGAALLAHFSPPLHLAARPSSRTRSAAAGGRRSTRRPSPARRSARNYYWRRARTRTFVIPPALLPLCTRRPLPDMRPSSKSF